MPRQARIIVPGLSHHIIQRGHNGQTGFTATSLFQRSVFIEAGDGSTKSDLMVSLGHEVLETQVLEGLGGGLFGIGSKPQKEALADAFGEQLAWRLGQVIDVGPDANGGEGFSDSLKQSDIVKYGTALADKVGSAKVEYSGVFSAVPSPPMAGVANPLGLFLATGWSTAVPKIPQKCSRRESRVLITATAM